LAWLFLELSLVACSGRSAAGGQPASWPDINPGCEQVTLIEAGQPPPPYRYHVLREFHGNWDEPDKSLRNWLVNKACEAGADAVIDVVETRGAGEDGPVWNIRGVAIVYVR
jgi:hypothetical protein